MTDAERSPAYYTCEVVSKCFTDADTRKGFMSAYSNSPEAAQAYLQQLGMPQDMATHVVGLQGNDLNLFIGQNVCDYLW